MMQNIDEIQVILMLEESMNYDWVQHLNILTPPDDKCLKYVRADELQPQQVDELLAIYIAYLQRWPTAPVFYVGLWVYVDVRLWTGSYANHESFFLKDWFTSLRTVLRGGESAKASVEIWEGCNLTIERTTDQLTLGASILGYNGTSITLNLWDFTRHLINAGEVYLELIEKLLTAIGTYNRSTSNAAELARIAKELSELDKNYVKTCVDDLRNELANQGTK